MTTRRPKRLRAALVLALSMTATAAHALPAPSHKLFLQSRVGLGYWHYFQTDFAPRELDGGFLEVVGAVGGSPAPGFIIAGQIVATLYFPTTGVQGSANQPLPSGVGGGGDLGALFTWMPNPDRPRFALQFGAGFTGGGAPPQVWGGVGPYLAPGASIVVLNSGKSHLAVDLRLKYAPLFSSDAPGATKNLVSISAGFGWIFY
jgi:hypothetical protein